MELNKLPKHKNYKRKMKIIGRGTSSGKGGHTVGRGMNGQTSRSGGNQLPRLDFEGGQNPLSRRLPKYRGFKRGFDKSSIVELKLSALNNFPKDMVVNMENLTKQGLIKKNIPLAAVKIIGEKKEYKGKHTFEGIMFTKSAKEVAQKSGANIK